MKVGDYVRTKDGIIDKVIIEYNGCCASQNCNCKHISCERNYYDEDKVIKSSPNIIDLIEVGDYVNGHRVFDKAPGCVYVENVENKINHIPITRDNLKSVLSKELFESMEYRIGD